MKLIIRTCLQISLEMHYKICHQNILDVIVKKILRMHLTVKKEFWLKHGQDQHRDHCTAMAQRARNNVEIEPILKKSDPLNNSPALQADFKN